MSTQAQTILGPILIPRAGGRVVGSANVLTWTSVPVDPPGSSGSRTFRIANIRANANRIGSLGPNGAAATIVATVSISGSAISLSAASGARSPSIE